MFRARGLWILGCAMVWIALAWGQIIMATNTVPKKPPVVMSLSLKKAVAEVKALQAQLEKVQKRLPVILNQLGMSDSVVSPTESPASTVVTNHLDHLVQHFRQRLSDFLSDFSLTTRMMGEHPVLKKPIKLHLLFLLASCLVSVFSVGLGGKFLQHRIEKSLFRLKFKSLLHLGRLNSLLLFPVPIYACISLILGFTMRIWGVKPLDGWSLNTCALFPLHFYCIWAMYTWIGMTWMPNRPSQGFVVMRPDDAHRTAFWLRMLIGVYAGSVAILGVIGLVFLESSEKNAVVRTIVDVAVMGSCWCGYKGLSLDRAALELNSDPKKILRAITSVRWLFAAMTVLFVMERQWFLYFLFPVVMTAMVWIFLFPTKEMFRYYRLRFLWKRRHKDFLLKLHRITHEIIQFYFYLFHRLLILALYFYIF
jgi:hypothetical protein